MAAEHRMLDVDAVEFDAANPRIAHYLETYEDVDPELVAYALNPGDAKFMELQQAIRTNEGIVNPIIVNAVEGRLIAIEGNTRLAIYKKFLHHEPSNETWQRIPAIVYEDMSQTAVDAVRLQAHLVGVRNWTPYAKAKYLHMLHVEERLPLNSLVDFCGGNSLDVLRNIEAYKAMENEYRPLVPPDQFNQRKFSLFFEVQKPAIRQAIARAGFTTSNFAEWVRDDKFHPRQELVRDLPKILASPRAREVFLREGAQSAERFIDRPALSRELEAASLEDLCTALIEKIKNLTLRERDEIQEDEGAVQTVEDATIWLRNFFERELHER